MPFMVSNRSASYAPEAKVAPIAPRNCVAANNQKLPMKEKMNHERLEIALLIARLSRRP